MSIYSMTYVDEYVVHYATVVCACGVSYLQRTTDDRVECYECEDELVEGNSWVRTRGI